MCAKRALASSAALAASRGRMNTLGTESMAAMERISLEHLQYSMGPRAHPSAMQLKCHTLCICFMQSHKRECLLIGTLVRAPEATHKRPPAC